MNQEQIKSIIRQLMLFIAGIIGGTTFVSKFFTQDQVVSFLTSDTVLGILGSLITGGIASVWALVSRSDKNLVRSAEAVPAVAGVITKPTPEGRELASNIPGQTVVPAGTSQAKEIASNKSVGE